MLWKNKLLYTLGIFLFIPGVVIANSTGSINEKLDLTRHFAGYLSIGIFVVAYLILMLEEFTHLRKSKPVMLAAGLMWSVIAIVYVQNDLPNTVAEAVRHNILEYAELLLFLLVAMTYISALDERAVFAGLRAWLINRGYGFRALFWMTGILAFFISPIADNLTTALIMCAVVLAVGGENKCFVNLSCINVVVAANAGGAFSPFGDITTLMVWQKGIVDFFTFFKLFIPSVVNFVLPAIIMQFAVPNIKPTQIREEIHLRRGAKRMITLFLLTIASAVSFHSFLHLPPMLGMMTGLAYLQIFGYYLKKTHYKDLLMYDRKFKERGIAAADDELMPFDVFRKISRADWDTLLFFYGVILCVGALGFIGYLQLTSEVLYGWNHTYANSLVGILSAIVDNIPVMFAILSMNPDMSLGQWLLVTLTTGVGGSLLSIGSAAGVALMGQSKGRYTFFSHLRWSPVIFLGYVASILTHLWLNADSFNVQV